MSQDTNKVAKQSKLHFIKTQENIYQACVEVNTGDLDVEGGCQLTLWDVS